MRKITFAVVPSKQYNKFEQYPIKMRVTWMRRPMLLTTPYAAAKNEITFNPTFGLKPKSGTAQLAEAYVNTFREAAARLDPEQLNDLSVGQVFKLVQQKRDRLINKNASVAIDFPDYMTAVADTKKESTRQSYLNALKSLSSFLGKEHYDISEITSSTLKKYEKHLLTKYGRYSSTITLYIGNIKNAHRAAQEEYNNEELDETPIKNPFAYFKPIQQPVKKIIKPVSKKMIQYLIDNLETFNTASRQAAELFLMSFACQGINVTDIYYCKKPKDWVLVFNRTKTKDQRADRAETHILIHECIRPLFEKNKDPDGELATCYARRYPKQSFDSQKAKWMEELRRTIKESPLRDEVQDLRYNAARHAYASISRSLGIEKNLIRDGMSHLDKDALITDIYIEKQWEPIWEANRKMLQLFNWKPIQRN